MSYYNLSSEERILIKRIVKLNKKGKIVRQFNLLPMMGKQGKLFLADDPSGFRSSDFTGYQGTIDTLAINGLLQYVDKDTYYLTQAAIDAVAANNFSGQQPIIQPVATKQKPINIRELSKWIEDGFNIREFKDLCFGLTEYENLHGDTIAEKSRELVSEMKRHGKIHKLIERIKQERPYQIQSLEDAIRK